MAKTTFSKINKSFQGGFDCVLGEWRLMFFDDFFRIIVILDLSLVFIDRNVLLVITINIHGPFLITSKILIYLDEF